MTGHDGSDPRLDIHDEAAAGGGPELVPATDEHVDDPAERGWVNPQTQEMGAASGAADGTPTAGQQVEADADDPDGRLWHQSKTR